MNFETTTWKIVQKVIWSHQKNEVQYTTIIAVKDDFSHIQESLIELKDQMMKEMQLLAVGCYDQIAFQLMDERGNIIKNFEMKNVKS